MNKGFFIGVCCLVWAVGAGAQDASDSLPILWTLDDCISYAKEQNISIKQNQLSQWQSDVDVKTAKAAYWPSLSFSTGHNYVNAPWSDPNNSYSGNVGLNASWTVWDGARQKNIEQQKLNSKVAELATAQTENSVVEQVMLIYVQILYAQESVTTNEASLASSEAQRDRAEQLLKAGSISKSDYAQLVSQCSNDKYTLVNSQATLRDYLLQLKQLLELDSDTELQVATPEYGDEAALEPLPALADVYRAALNSRPEIQSAQLDVESSELNVKIAKAGYQPSISLSAGTGTSFHSGSNYTFSEQIKTGWSNTVGLTLSVPIIGGRQNKSAVEKAKLQQKISELNKLDEEKTLRKIIEALWLDAQSTQEKFRAATEQIKATQESFDLVSEQFNLGIKNATELLTERTNLLQATQTALQSKYMAIYDINMLKFYKGE